MNNKSICKIEFLLILAFLSLGIIILQANKNGFVNNIDKIMLIIQNTD
jgi:hypothetical protein